MSIWNKILIGLVFVISVGFFYLAARTLKTHEYWCKSAQDFEARIEQIEAENLALVEGDENGETEGDKKGIKQIRADLCRLLIDRGRVWYNCAPGQPNAQTGSVAVTTDQPDPHNIAVKTVLYVFEEGDVTQKASYLGEFKVTGVDQKLVTLEPSVKLEANSPQLSRLVASSGPWSLYETMPIDSRETFADKSEEELGPLLPADRIAQFVHDGQKLTTAEVEEIGLAGGRLLELDGDEIVYEDENGRAVTMKVDENGDVVYWDKDVVVEPESVTEREVQDGSGRYVRPLNDYAIFCKDYLLRFAPMRDSIQAASRDKQYVETALADVKIQEQRSEATKTRLDSDLRERQREKKAVVDLLAELQGDVKRYQDMVEQVIASNKKAAQQIAAYQRIAAQRIDARSPRMVRSEAKAN